MISSTLIFVSVLLATPQVYAANDWSKPCLSGVCFYDLPSSSSSTSSGTLKIWGSDTAITDITAAADWEIIDCKPDATTQDIRLVCTSENSEKCGHLYKDIGAVGKVVRLPESCGKNAFAHVSRAWVPSDQSIPASISNGLAKRGVTKKPEVKALRLDTDFKSADTTKIGTVNFALTASTVPGAQDLVGFPSTSTSKSSKNKRQLRNIFNKAKDAVTGVVNDVVEGAKDFVDDAVDAVTGLNEVSVSESKTLDPFTVNKNFNLIDQQLSCPPLTGSLKIDVEAKAEMVVTLGVAAQGTVIPPKINDFGVSATMTGELDGALKLAAGLSGTIDTGDIELFEIGIPGLDFPGILTIGPTFSISAKASADLDLSADMTVGVNYRVHKATVVFPPRSKQAQAQGGAFKIGDTPLKLSVSPSAKARGSVTAHLIPSLNLGISALGDIVEAKVFVELDASASAGLEVEASGQATATVTRQRAQQVAGPRRRSQAEQDGVRGAGPLFNSYLEKRQRVNVSTTGNVAVGGCVDITAGLDVNAGADANFFGLFDAGTKVELFSRDFELFKRCFGTRAANARRSLGRFASRTIITARTSRRDTIASTFEKRALACPAESGEQAVASEKVVDEVIPAASIPAL